MFHGPSSVLLFLLCMFCINALLIFKWRTGGYKHYLSGLSSLDLSFFCTVGWVSTDCHDVGVLCNTHQFTNPPSLSVYPSLFSWSLSTSLCLQELPHCFCFDICNASFILLQNAYITPCMYLVFFCPGIPLMWALIHHKTHVHSPKAIILPHVHFSRSARWWSNIKQAAITWTSGIPE